MAKKAKKAKGVKAGRALLVDRMAKHFPQYRIDPDTLTGAIDDGYLVSRDVESWRREGVLWFDLGKIARGEDDANQTSTVDRSNFRSLIRDYGSYGEPIGDGDVHAFLPVSYSNVDGLGILARDLTSDLVDILVGLASEYPAYNDDDWSSLESDEIHDAWEQYMRADVSSAIQDISESAWDVWTEMPEHMQQRIFWDVQSDHDYYPEHGGLDIHWETDDIAGWIVDRIGPWARVIGGPGQCIAAGTLTLF